LGAAVAGSAGFALGPAVEVVNLIDGKGQPIDLDSVAVLVLVVAHAPDNIHVRAFAQVLGGVLGLLAPPRPLDRGGFFFALLAAAAAGVADGGQHRFGELALTPVDEFELDGTGQVRVALDDLNVGHDGTPCVSDQPDPDAGSTKTDPLARTPSLPPTGGRGVGRAPSLGKGWGMGKQTQPKQ
jgi:hypothetical protein